MKKFLFPLIFIFISCNGNIPTLTKEEEDNLKAVMNSKAHNAASYSQDILAKPFWQRVQTAPDFLMEYLVELDQMPGYKPYTPTAKQLAEISNYLEMLPPLHKKVMKERLLGIFFIDTFMGGGMTDICIDDKGEVYFFIVFNPETLNHNFDKWVTMKDETCFIPGGSGDNLQVHDKDVSFPVNQVDISMNGNYSGFFYILLHEGTHGVDYVKNITPYVEPLSRNLSIYFNKPVKETSDFTKGIWDDIASPIAKYDFPLRKSITVYGWGGGPKIAMKDMAGLYRSLSGTPFVSIYGSKSWAEDLAEFVTYYHLTQKLGHTYTISVVSNGETVFTYSPMTNKSVLARFDSVQLFYQ